MKFLEPICLVAISLWAHANKWYAVSNNWLTIVANISSTCFLLAAALFIVQRLEQVKYPWNRRFTSIYIKGLVMLVLPTLVHAFVWMPLTYGIAAAHDLQILMACPPLQAVEQMLLAVLTLIYSVMVATGHDCQLKAWLASLKTQ